MSELDTSEIRALVASFLAEDVGRGDRTTEAVIPAVETGRARIEARAAFVVAGLDLARMCFEAAASGDLEWAPFCRDGDRVEQETVLAHVQGSLRAILTGERTALNLVGRLSGVATSARRLVDAVAGTAATIVDTRKTTPGLRVLEKYAVRCGGASNHRFGLDDGVLIKDNHVAAAGGVGEAVMRARKRIPHGLKIEVEVSDFDSLDEALAAGADAILLDNMTPELVAAAVGRAGGKVILEASGGITLANARAFAEAGVDLISSGAMTHSVASADVALEVE
jgi:nicotinate-nucleotide pyrophosphorylase (carboxylating)